MQPAKRVAFNTGVLYARMGVTVFISLYVTRLILGALGTQDFGIFNLVGGAIAMLTFLNIAMTSASQRFMSYAQGEGDLQKQKYIFNVSVIVHLMISLILFVGLECVGYLLFNGFLNIPENRIKSAVLVYHFMLVSTFFTINSVPYDAVLNAHEHMLVVAILGIIDAVLKLVIAIYITYSQFDKLEAYGFLMAGLAFVLFILKRIYCHRRYKEVQISFKKYFNKPLFKEMASFAGWALLSSAASIITMQGITLVLNSFFGVVVNAAQGIANQISSQLMAFSNTMLKALNPVIVKSEGGNNREQMLKASMIGNKISFFLLTFLSIPILLEMPFILDIWLTNVPEYAVVFCRLILIRLSIGQLTVTFPTAIGAVGIIKQSSLWDSLIYISVLPISYVVFKILTIPSLIYVVLIFMVIMLSVSRIYFVQYFAGLSTKVFFMNVVIPCLGTALFAFILASIPLFWVEKGIVRLMIIVTIHIVSFTTFLFLIGLKKNEKQLMLSVLRTALIKIKTVKHYATGKGNY